MRLIETLTDDLEPADAPGSSELDTPAAPEPEDDLASITSSEPDELSGFKDFLKTNKTALKIFIRLYDLYREDGNLNSKDAQGLTSDLMSLFKGTESSQLGVAKWEPNQLAFAMFLDEIGDQPLAEFLGIKSVADLPNADLESRADDIRKSSIEKPQEPPQPQLSSVKPKARNPLAECRTAGYGRGSFMRLHREAVTARRAK